MSSIAALLLLLALDTSGQPPEAAPAAQAAAPFGRALASRADAQDWPRFRGPDGQGHSPETNLPLEWSATANVAWKAAIPGEGWSSPIVPGDRVFLTSALDAGRSCHVICVSAADGRRV